MRCGVIRLALTEYGRVLAFIFKVGIANYDLRKFLNYFEEGKEWQGNERFHQESRMRNEILHRDNACFAVLGILSIRLSIFYNNLFNGN